MFDSISSLLKIKAPFPKFEVASSTSRNSNKYADSRSYPFKIITNPNSTCCTGYKDRSNNYYPLEEIMYSSILTVRSKFDEIW